MPWRPSPAFWTCRSAVANPKRLRSPKSPPHVTRGDRRQSSDNRARRDGFAPFAEQRAADQCAGEGANGQRGRGQTTRSSRQFVRDQFAQRHDIQQFAHVRRIEFASRRAKSRPVSVLRHELMKQRGGQHRAHPRDRAQRRRLKRQPPNRFVHFSFLSFLTASLAGRERRGFGSGILPTDAAPQISCAEINTSKGER